MTDESKPKAKREYDAFAVQDDKDGKGHFHKIGAAFAHKDGEGYEILAAAMPVNGRITLRRPKERIKEQRESRSSDRRERGRDRDR